MTCQISSKSIVESQERIKKNRKTSEIWVTIETLKEAMHVADRCERKLF